MLHDRSLRKGRDRSLAIERDRVSFATLTSCFLNNNNTIHEDHQKTQWVGSSVILWYIVFCLSVGNQSPVFTLFLTYYSSVCHLISWWVLFLSSLQARPGLSVKRGIIIIMLSVLSSEVWYGGTVRYSHHLISGSDHFNNNSCSLISSPVT